MLRGPYAKLAAKLPVLERMVREGHSDQEIADALGFSSRNAAATCKSRLRKRGVLPPIVPAWEPIRRMVLEGLSTEQIAEALGYKKRVVIEYKARLRQAGRLPPVPRGEERKKKLSGAARRARAAGPKPVLIRYAGYEPKRRGKTTNDRKIETCLSGD